MLANTLYQRCANALALPAAPIITKYSSQETKAVLRLKSARFFTKTAVYTEAGKSKRNWRNKDVAYLAAAFAD